MRVFILFFMLISLLGGMNLQAEEKHTTDRVQLKKLLTDIELALNQADIEQLISYLHDDVVVTFLNAEVARGIPAVRRYFEKTMVGENALLADYHTQAKISAPAIFFDNVALAQGSAQDEFTLSDGIVLPVDTLWSASMVKQGEQWKVAQLHFSSNLFDNALLTSVEKSIMIFSAIAAFIGLLIGFFISSFLSKISRKKT